MKCLVQVKLKLAFLSQTTDSPKIRDSPIEQTLVKTTMLFFCANTRNIFGESAFVLFYLIYNNKRKLKDSITPKDPSFINFD